MHYVELCQIMNISTTATELSTTSEITFSWSVINILGNAILRTNILKYEIEFSEILCP